MPPKKSGKQQVRGCVYDQRINHHAQHKVSAGGHDLLHSVEGAIHPVDVMLRLGEKEGRRQQHQALGRLPEEGTPVVTQAPYALQEERRHRHVEQRQDTMAQ
jgi:hypothetical protein